MPSRPTTPVDRPRVGRPEGITLGLVVAVFALVLGLWAVLVPPFQAPDEKAHFDTALHLAIGDAWVGPGDQRFLNAVQAAAGQAAAGTDSLPAASRATVQELRAAHPGVDPGAVDQMTQHPPTAYLLQAAVLRTVGFEHLRWDHALLVLRLFDALVVLPLPVLAWAAVRRLTRSPRAAVVGAAAVLAVPELASIAASVTNDALTMSLGGLVTAVLVLALTGDRRPRVRCRSGSPSVCSSSRRAPGSPPSPWSPSPCSSAPVPRRGSSTRRDGRGAPAGRRRRRVVVGAEPRRVPDPPARRVRGHPAPAVLPAGQGPDALTFVDVSWGTVIRTFWGSFGSNAFASMSPWLLVPLTLVTVGVVAVLAFRRGPARRTAVLLAVFPVLLLAAQTSTSVHGYLTTTMVVGTQGRYLFPAVLALIVLSALAWRRLTARTRLRRLLPVGLVVGMIVLAAVGLATARGRLVPGAGYAVWSDASLGATATGVLAFVALLAAAVAVVGVARLPSTPPDAVDSPVHPPR